MPFAHCWTWPGAKDPEVIAFFDREDKASLPAIVGQLAMEMAGPGKSIMVHVEGTRSMDVRQPVEKMSGKLAMLPPTCSALNEMLVLLIKRSTTPKPSGQPSGDSFLGPMT